METFVAAPPSPVDSTATAALHPNPPQAFSSTPSANDFKAILTPASSNSSSSLEADNPNHLYYRNGDVNTAALSATDDDTQAPHSAASLWVSMPARPSSSWVCHLCLVRNEEDRTECACCEEPRPDAKVSGKEKSCAGSTGGTSNNSSAFAVSSSCGFSFTSSSFPPTPASFTFGGGVMSSSQNGQSSISTTSSSSAFVFGSVEKGKTSKESSQESHGHGRKDGDEDEDVLKKSGGGDERVADSQTENHGHDEEERASEGLDAAELKADKILTNNADEEMRDDGMDGETFDDLQVPDAPSLVENQLPTAEIYMFGSGELDQLPFFTSNPSSQATYHADSEEEEREVVHPRHVQELKGLNVISMSCGAFHNAVTTANGHCYTFGCNDDGAVGRLPPPDTKYADDDSIIPRPIDVGKPVHSVSCGDTHTSILTRDGEVFVCGNYRDSSGVLGFPEFCSPKENEAQSAIDKAVTPTKIRFTSADDPYQPIITKLASGENHTVCLDETGEVWVFGSNEFGQLAMPNAKEPSTVEEKIALLHPHKVDTSSFVDDTTGGVCDIFCGRATLFFVTANRYVFGCGRNAQGEVGCGVDGDREQVIFRPAEVRELRGLKLRLISGGQFFSAALDEDGFVYTWGSSNFTGHGKTDQTILNHPRRLEWFVKRRLKILTLGCGADHCLCTSHAGLLFTWGAGQNYQLGNAKDVDFQLLPKLVNPDLLEGHYVLLVSTKRLVKDCALPTPSDSGRMCHVVWQERNPGPFSSVQATGGSQHSAALVWNGHYAALDSVKVSRKRPRETEERQKAGEASDLAEKEAGLVKKVNLHHPETPKAEEVSTIVSEDEGGDEDKIARESKRRAVEGPNGEREAISSTSRGPCPRKRKAAAKDVVQDVDDAEIVLDSEKVCADGESDVEVKEVAGETDEKGIAEDGMYDRQITFEDPVPPLQRSDAAVRVEEILTASSDIVDSATSLPARVEEIEDENEEVAEADVSKTNQDEIDPQAGCGESGMDEEKDKGLAKVEVESYTFTPLAEALDSDEAIDQGFEEDKLGPTLSNATVVEADEDNDLEVEVDGSSELTREGEKGDQERTVVGEVEYQNSTWIEADVGNSVGDSAVVDNGAETEGKELAEDGSKGVKTSPPRRPSRIGAATETKRLVEDKSLNPGESKVRSVRPGSKKEDKKKDVLKKEVAKDGGDRKRKIDHRQSSKGATSKSDESKVVKLVKKSKGSKNTTSTKTSPHAERYSQSQASKALSPSPRLKAAAPSVTARKKTVAVSVKPSTKSSRSSKEERSKAGSKSAASPSLTTESKKVSDVGNKGLTKKIKRSDDTDSSLLAKSRKYSTPSSSSTIRDKVKEQKSIEALKSSKDKDGKKGGDSKKGDGNSVKSSAGTRKRGSGQRPVPVTPTKKISAKGREAVKVGSTKAVMTASKTIQKGSTKKKGLGSSGISTSAGAGSYSSTSKSGAASPPKPPGRSSPRLRASK